MAPGGAQCGLAMGVAVTAAGSEAAGLASGADSVVAEVSDTCADFCQPDWAVLESFRQQCVHRALQAALMLQAVPQSCCWWALAALAQSSA